MVMTVAGCSLSVDAAKIATITFDLPGKVNVMNDDFLRVMDEFVGHLEVMRNDLRGVVIRSAKSTFFAGGDLSLMGRAKVGEETYLIAHFERLKGYFRRLEKLGCPIVAAISGSALGGGLELALACHYRIAQRKDGLLLGLPEVRFGILPGAGGVVRLTALVGLGRALNYLLSGKTVDVETATHDGIIDEAVEDEVSLIVRARAWIDENPHPIQPWDSNVRSEDVSPLRPDVAEIDNLAKRIIAEVAIQSVALDVDSALRLETEALIDLMVRPETADLIASFFHSRQANRAGVAKRAGRGS